ncbi:MAG: FKBP-type peptidyl-prolyl cis-trans isomerase, partial [Aliifodinibius sp.]|nr:FKBP-type peptidyl-prolyl cis-trans isomerase [Fodinibius sp.]
MRYFLIGLLIVAFISCQSQQTGQTTLIKSLETSEDSLGYSLGQQMAKSIKSGSGKFNDEALLQGVMDALNDSESKLTDAEIQKHYKDFRTILAEEQQKIRQQQASENMAEAEEFLEANKNEEGVVTLPSGLQYK